MSFSQLFSLLFSCQVSPTFCNPMDWSTPCLPVPHHLPEFAKDHVHWIGDVIQPPISSFVTLFSSLFNLSQHQGLFQWVCSLHQVAKVFIAASASVLPMNIQGWFPFGLTGLILLLSKEISRVFSNTTIQKQKFFGPSLLYGPTLISVHAYWKNHSFDYPDLCRPSDVSVFYYSV